MNVWESAGLLDIGGVPSSDEAYLMLVSASGSVVMDSASGHRGSLSAVRAAESQGAKAGESARGGEADSVVGIRSAFACQRIALPVQDTQTEVLLGMVDGVPVFARLLDENPSLATSGLAVETVAQSGMEQGGLGGGADSAVVSAGEHHEDEELVSLRSALALVGDVDTGLLMRAAALAGYHSSHQFCSICGKATRAVDWGRSRQCDSCDTRHFPRIDPAVIVAIKDDSDRLLLGHHVGWEDTRRSLFAGFVEAGESVEQAIHRELAEEVGLEVDSLVYAGSQPWPMPRSLMLGFWAHAEGEVRVDGEEITNAAWYTRQSLQEAAARGEVTLPPRASIAARLVQQWLDCPDVDGR